MLYSFQSGNDGGFPRDKGGVVLAVEGSLTAPPMSAAQSAGHQSIVGLCSVISVSFAGGPTIPGYQLWHSDGLEFDVAGSYLGAVCPGTFEQTKDGVVHLYHVAWTFDPNGALNGNWVEHATFTVSTDGNSYSGNYTKDFYDLNYNFLFEDTKTVIKLTPRS